MKITITHRAYSAWLIGPEFKFWDASASGGIGAEVMVTLLESATFGTLITVNETDFRYNRREWKAMSAYRPSDKE